MEEIYIVQRGDTLYGIAKEFDTSVQSIIENNDLIDNIIYVGQSLVIVKDGDSTPEENISYIVQKGDNLYSIARKYDTTVNEIKRYNNLSSNLLSIGQKLVIPINMSVDNNIKNYVSYVVEKGDSLYSIAKKYSTTVTKIIKDNNLENTFLSIGDVLLIENNNIDNMVDECFGEEYIEPVESFIYIVKKGDSLYSIAKMFGTTVDKIISFNNLSDVILDVGEELKIPSSGEITYVVQKGESLYSIAKKFNTTVDEIKRKNNLSNSLLSVGQKLLI